jgi:hypothetical protein
MKFALVIVEGGWKDTTNALEIISTLGSSSACWALAIWSMISLSLYGRCPEILLTYGRTIAVDVS